MSLIVRGGSQSAQSHKPDGGLDESIGGAFSLLLIPEKDTASQLFSPVILPVSFERVYNFGTSAATGHRVQLRFDEPARILVTIESAIATRRRWRRAGILAQVLHGLPGQPKKDVRRVYIDSTVFELDGGGEPYILEFWSLVWISDYYLEIFAQAL